MYNLKNSIIILIVSATVIYGQNLSSNSPNISFFGGDLSILSEKFTDYFDSKNDFIFGVGLGFPVSNSLTLDASVSYFRKKSNFDFENQLNFVKSAKLKQLIINAGVQLNLIPHRLVEFSFLAGFNYAFIDEERKSSDGSIIYQVTGDGNFGIYGGVEFELNLGHGPISLFGDAKYVYSWNPILNYAENYREIKYTAGLKLFFFDRWK